MDLFNSGLPGKVNLLPKDGVVNYYGTVFSALEAKDIFTKLFAEIAWQHDEAVVFGKHITTKRKAAWYGAKPFSYTYSGITKTALPFTPMLLALKEKCEALTAATYNSCLLNLYHDGSEVMAWHSDAEKELLKEGAIASLSFGAIRKFAFKHKVDKTTVSVALESGSLLVMKGTTQVHWLHRLPPSTLVKTPRINLTFRTIAT